LIGLLAGVNPGPGKERPMAQRAMIDGMGWPWARLAAAWLVLACIAAGAASAAEATDAAAPVAASVALEPGSQIAGALVAAGAELIPGQAPGGGAVVRSETQGGNQVLELKLPAAVLAHRPKVEVGGTAGSRLLGEGLTRAARLLVMIHGGDAGLGGREVRLVAVTAKLQKEVAKLRLGPGWQPWALDVPALVEDAPVQRLLIRSGTERPVFVAAAAANPDAQPLARELPTPPNPLLPLVYDGPRGLRDLVLAAITARDAEPEADGIELLFPGQPAVDAAAAQRVLAALRGGWGGGGKAGGGLRWYPDQPGLSTPFNDLVNRKPQLLALYLASDQPPRVFDTLISSDLVTAAKNGTIGVVIVDAARAAGRQRAEWDAWLAKLRAGAPGVAVLDLAAAVDWQALPGLPPVARVDDAQLDAALACGMRDLRARLAPVRREAQQILKEQRERLKKRGGLLGR
jgi:hypothetical protein